MAAGAGDPVDERVSALWDELAAFDAASTEEALRHALTRLSALIDAQRSFWLGGVRLAPREGDPLDGWRPAAISDFVPDPGHDPRFREHRRRMNEGQVDPGLIASVQRAGEFRITVTHEVVPPGWYESEFYRNFFAETGLQDMILVTTPLGPDVESWLGFERIDHAEGRFGPREREVLEAACRPLTWFHQRVALHYGIQLAAKPLTRTERRVLSGLLGDGSEVEIAAALGLSRATVHTYCTRIARKFNVRGRAGLMALWLGATGPQ